MQGGFLPKAVRKYSNVIIKRGIGSWIYDIHNNKYLDFTSGIGVLSLGHNNKQVNDAIKKQLDLYNHAQQMCLYDPRAMELSKKMVSITPKHLNYCFFTPSGSEAVDASIRIARYYTKKKRILSVQRGFHGRTLGVMALTENVVPQRNSIEPFVDLCNCTPNIIEHIKLIKGENIAAVIIEPIQGEGGIYKHDVKFIQSLREICTQFNILLIVDEIQCGLCRTGKFFAFHHFDITPDIILLAKGIANGIPLGAVISRDDIFESCPIGSLGGTYGGNALSMSASIVVLEIMISSSLDEQVHLKGKYVEEYIQDLRALYPAIEDIRVYGLMIGIEFKYDVKNIRNDCEKAGLLVLPTNSPKIIRFLPPLNITLAELKIGLDIFKKVLQNTHSVADTLIDESYISTF